MRPHLIPCTNCQRHVRATEQSCPFCGVECQPDAGQAPRNPTGRPTSLAVMTFRVAAVGAVVAACGGSGDDQDGSGDAGAAGDDSSTSSGGTGSGATSSGGVPDDTTPSRGGTGSGGTRVIGTGGIENTGGAVPIYRATPKG